MSPSLPSCSTYTGGSNMFNIPFSSLMTIILVFSQMSSYIPATNNCTHKTCNLHSRLLASPGSDTF